MSDREVEHSELWNTVFASGCVHSDDLNVERKVRADPAVLLSLIVCARCRYPSAKKTPFIVMRFPSQFGGSDVPASGAHVLQLQLSPPPPSSSAPIKSRKETFWYRLTQFHLEKWLLKWRETWPHAMCNFLVIEKNN